MDRMTHSVPTSHPLSPATTVIDLWAPEQSGHSDRDRGEAQVQQHECPITKADLAAITTEYSWPAADTNGESLIGHRFPGHS